MCFYGLSLLLLHLSRHVVGGPWLLLLLLLTINFFMLLPLDFVDELGLFLKVSSQIVIVVEVALFIFKIYNLTVFCICVLV